MSDLKITDQRIKNLAALHSLDVDDRLMEFARAVEFFAHTHVAAAQPQAQADLVNQCDGCQRGLPLVNGIHRGDGYDRIGCTADRYKAEPSPDTEQPLPPGSRARGVLLQASLIIGELSKNLEQGDPTWEELQKFGRDFDAVMTGTGDTEQQRRDAGLPVEQEPKYTVQGGRIVNRASGDPIPDDEPVFIFRARDRFACDVLAHYCALLPIIPNPHLTAVFNRLQHFHRFAADHPHRMKTPDTDVAAIEAERSS